MTQTTTHGAHGAQPFPLLDEWQKLTRAGLAASQACCAAHALTWHARALQVAHQLLAGLEDGVEDDDRIAAFVVSHLNIADCYAEMDQPARAAECLCCAHHKLMALLDGDAVPQSLQIIASRQLRQTYAAMSEYRARHGAHPQIEQALRACHAHIPAPGAWLH